MTKMPLQAVVGVICNDEQEVLVSLRPPHTTMPGRWEFPGGKVEAGETYLQAIKRELKEELGIDIQTALPFMDFIHDYGDRQVSLNVWFIQKFIGMPIGAEGQQIRWIKLSDFSNLPFLTGCFPIIEKIKTFFKVNH